jgi:hypothetical protein
VRFRKFKIVLSAGWFKLLGYLNPWVVLMSGPSKGKTVHVDQPGKFKLGGEIDVDGVEAIVVGLKKKAPREYRKILARAKRVGVKSLAGEVIHHLLERQVVRRFKLSKLVNDALMHAPANLRAIPKGFINEVVHLSKIRVMWDDCYREIRTLATAEARYAAMQHFVAYTERFIDDMLKVGAQSGMTKAELRKAAEAWLENDRVADAVKEAVEVGRKKL